MMKQLKKLRFKYMTLKEYVDDRQKHYIKQAQRTDLPSDEREGRMKMSSRLCAESIAYRQVIDDLDMAIREVEHELEAKKRKEHLERCISASF